MIGEKWELLKSLWKKYGGYATWFIVINRAMTAPFLLWEARSGHPGIVFLMAFSGAFFGDVFDGMIARKLGVSNQKLRQADSFADICLYASVAISAYWSFPEIVLQYRTPLLALAGLQAIWLIAGLLKYRRPACYHSYSAKAWGASIYLASMTLFLTHEGGWAIWLMIGIGICHTLEEIAMTAVLPTWTHDVLSFRQALKLSQLQVAHGKS